MLIELALTTHRVYCDGKITKLFRLIKLNNPEYWDY